jgi:hypothetical protein
MLRHPSSRIRTISGYTHQVRGFYSQMVFDESFEEGVWPSLVEDPGVVAAIATSNTTTFHGHASLSITTSNAGFAGVGNRGLGNEGLVFKVRLPLHGRGVVTLS